MTCVVLYLNDLFHLWQDIQFNLRLTTEAVARNCPIRTVFLKISQISQESVSFLKTFSKILNVIKKIDSGTDNFSANFVKFLRTLIL